MTDIRPQAPLLASAARAARPLARPHALRDDLNMGACMHAEGSKPPNLRAFLPEAPLSRRPIPAGPPTYLTTHPCMPLVCTAPLRWSRSFHMWLERAFSPCGGQPGEHPDAHVNYTRVSHWAGAFLGISARFRCGPLYAPQRHHYHYRSRPTLLRPDPTLATLTPVLC